jgi:hypothetical protein
MMRKYLNHLRLAILFWKQKRVLEKCARECPFSQFTGVYMYNGHIVCWQPECKHSKPYNEYEAKISQITND